MYIYVCTTCTYSFRDTCTYIAIWIYDTVLARKTFCLVYNIKVPASACKHE